MMHIAIHILVLHSIITVNNVVLALREGVRCRDPDNEKFMFHYYNSEAFVCQDFKKQEVTGYEGGCEHEGRAVFRFRNNAWQTCVNGRDFTDIACVFDEECALKSNLISAGIRGWNSPSSEGSCNALRAMILSDTQKYKVIVPKFSTCYFGDYATQSNLVTCDYTNYSQPGHDPDACRNGPERLVFYVDNKPEYCIIRTKDSFNGLCLPIGRVWQALKTNYSTYAQRESNYASNFEYRRYAIEQKMAMYGQSYPGYNGDLKTLFTAMATHVTTNSPEVHSVQIDEVKVGANAFCEVALKLFPIESYQIYQAVLPEECPCIKQDCVNSQSADLLNTAPYPKNLYKIWFNANKLPLKCFIPQNFHGKTDGKNYCIEYSAAVNLINTRENNRRNSNSNKNDYQATMVRVMYDPINYQTPWHWRFDARSAEPLSNVLRDMAESLGYFNERHENVQFTVSGQAMKMGAMTFCAILNEMIPFHTNEFRDTVQEC